jgi:CheY-like chemotaxis protein
MSIEDTAHAMLVLLVEDSPDHAELVQRSLADHRVASRIIHLTDGQQAIDYLLRRGAWSDPVSSPRPQLILLDLRLPRVDGLEVLDKIKGEPEVRSIPVVVLTTSDADRDVARAYDRHANSYLVKPVDFHQFRKLMEDLGQYWLHWNRQQQAS